MASIAIGDVHGNLPALDDLLGKLELTPEDTLIFLGDLIDRGPDTKGCLDRLVRLQTEAPCPVRFVLGNHEEWFLRTLDDFTKHSWLTGMNGRLTMTSYSPSVTAEILAEMKELNIRLLTEKLPLSYGRFFDVVPQSHLDLLRGMVPFVRTDDGVFVHGGLACGQGPVEEQDPKILPWGDTAFPDGYVGADPIVYGHHDNAVFDERNWPNPRLLPNKTYGLDTIRYGVLTAIRMPEAEVIQSGKHLA
jgi:serine/threonine protein phosphatase 1